MSPLSACAKRERSTPIYKRRNGNDNVSCSDTYAYPAPGPPGPQSRHGSHTDELYVSPYPPSLTVLDSFHRKGALLHWFCDHKAYIFGDSRLIPYYTFHPPHPDRPRVTAISIISEDPFFSNVQFPSFGSSHPHLLNHPSWSKVASIDRKSVV